MPTVVPKLALASIFRCLNPAYVAVTHPRSGNSGGLAGAGPITTWTPNPGRSSLQKLQGILEAVDPEAEYTDVQ